ncbi:hypothetical protein [Shimia sp. MIT1388]|uniref:hypothetical protein n=1 Tax=Shimia sp. MIT1388 TaxID=3096992 RepID=UPI00399B7756
MKYSMHFKGFGRYLVALGVVGLICLLYWTTNWRRVGEPNADHGLCAKEVLDFFLTADPLRDQACEEVRLASDQWTGNSLSVLDKDFFAGLDDRGHVDLSTVLPDHVSTVCVITEYTYYLSDIPNWTVGFGQPDVAAMLPSGEHEHIVVYFDQNAVFLGGDRLRNSLVRAGPARSGAFSSESSFAPLYGCTEAEQVSIKFQRRERGFFGVLPVVDFRLFKAVEGAP